MSCKCHRTAELRAVSSFATRPFAKYMEYDGIFTFISHSLPWTLAPNTPWKHRLFGAIPSDPKSLWRRWRWHCKSGLFWTALALVRSLCQPIFTAPRSYFWRTVSLFLWRSHNGYARDKNEQEIQTNAASQSWFDYTHWKALRKRCCDQKGVKEWNGQTRHDKAFSASAHMWLHTLLIIIMYRDALIGYSAR